MSPDVPTMPWSQGCCMAGNRMSPQGVPRSHPFGSGSIMFPDNMVLPVLVMETKAPLLTAREEWLSELLSPSIRQVYSSPINLGQWGGGGGGQWGDNGSHRLVTVSKLGNLSRGAQP